MQLSEECQKEIDRRCSESKTIKINENALVEINGKIEKLWLVVYRRRWRLK